MGVWAWLREFFEASEAAAMLSPAADLSLTLTSDNIAEITRLVLSKADTR